jgi:peptidoglycan/xylan/chitin deacetylase (PgdA/CDA1 family)
MVAKLRGFLHYLAALLAHYSGMLSLRSFFRRNILRRTETHVLGLHRVLTQEEFIRANSLPGMILKETTFAKLLEYICRHWETVPLDAFLEGGGKTASSRPRLLLTFDDGWRDNYITAYRWLKKFRVPATIFVSVEAVEKQEPFWIERLAREWRNSSRQAHMQSQLQCLFPSKRQLLRLDETIEALKHMPSQRRQQILDVLLPSNESVEDQGAADRMLTWDQMLEMSRDGVEFGSHTVTHPLLTYENDVTVREELCASKRILEGKLNQRVRAFAYPNGDCNTHVRKQVREAGYECAFVTRGGGSIDDRDPFAIRRVILHDGNVTRPDGRFSPAMFCLTLARSS